MQPKFFDAHGHINFVAYKDDREEVIKRNLDAGVWMAAVGTQKDTSKAAVELAEKKDGVFAVVGLHPIHTGKSFHDEEELGQGGEEFTSRGEEFDYDHYKKLAEHPKVVAIGECGLDYYRIDANIRIYTNDTNLKQEEAFRKQIELASAVKKPLMLHLRSGSGRSAYNDAFRILKTCNLQRITNPGDLHSFAGTVEEAKPFLDAGFYFSFTGAVTFPPRKGEKENAYHEVIRFLPLDRLMAETDCPYLSPVPFRGERNEPFHVEEVVKKIAEVRGEDFEAVRNKILGNTLEFFGL